jgi:hypothetical protein
MIYTYGSSTRAEALHVRKLPFILYLIVLPATTGIKHPSNGSVNIIANS